MTAHARESMRILVAVDFGTTFSSMAFASSRNHTVQEVVHRWEDGAMTGENLPTVLQYPEIALPGCYPEKWGSLVRREDDDSGEIYEWFKLNLYPHLQDTELGRKYPPRTPHVSEEICRKLVVDFLSAMKKNFDQILRGRFGPLVSSSLAIEYIITVPAIWTDRGKDITRRCAVEAGMGSENAMKIIKEPEAAGIWALQSMRDIHLQVNDTFVLCDAGGGTVDLISYTVKALEPHPNLTESAPGSGGLCGGSFLNRAFEAWLDQRFHDDAQLTAELRLHILERFEVDIKKRFNGSAREPYTIMTRGFPDDYSRGVQDGRLTIPTSHLKAIFREVTDKIVHLVLAQINATEPRVKSVLLAGGFGQSEYVRLELEKAIRRNVPGTTVSMIMNSDTAIVRGALLRGLTGANSDLPYARTEGRIATKSYGMRKWVPFDANQGHDPGKMEMNPFTKGHQIETMDWFIGQGSKVEEAKPLFLQLYSRKFWDGNPLKPMEISIYTHEDARCEAPPNEITRDLTIVARLTARLDRIPVSNLDKSRGRDGRLWHSANFDLKTTLDSANLLTFVVEHAGVSYGESSVSTRFL